MYVQVPLIDTCTFGLALFEGTQHLPMAGVCLSLSLPPSLSLDKHSPACVSPRFEARLGRTERRPASVVAIFPSLPSAVWLAASSGGVVCALCTGILVVWLLVMCLIDVRG